MRVLVQRVASAEVRRPDTGQASAIGTGLLLLAGFRESDDTQTLEWMAEKCLGLRIFGDDSGHMNRSVGDVHGSLLVVPNFTLYGDGRKGRRPSFSEAAKPERAQELLSQFVQLLQRGTVPIATGFFQTHMQVALVNDGPVTLLLER